MKASVTIIQKFRIWYRTPYGVGID